MLINALCDYYDVLASMNKTLPPGYSYVKIHFLICLTTDGIIDEIVDIRKDGKTPKEYLFPLRTEKPGIESNIVEHRGKYIFGLNYDKKEDVFTDVDKTDKAKISHTAFKKKNTEFFKDLDSEIITAYKLFLKKWIPEKEFNNKELYKIKDSYENAGFAFCLSGHVNELLQDDFILKQKWETANPDDGAEASYEQCAVYGENKKIAKLHNKIKGLRGGSTTGSVLVGYNNQCDCSYGNEQAFNSNISLEAMKKYTESLNYLLGNTGNNTVIDDITLIFWSMDGSKKADDLFSSFCFGSGETDSEETEQIIKELLQDVRNAGVMKNKIREINGIDEKSEYYVVGLKPNVSRISIKFIYRKSFGEMLERIASFQNDLMIDDKRIKPVELWQIKNELKPTSNDKEIANPGLISKLLESILIGKMLPDYLLENIIRRVKTDRDTLKRKQLSDIRVGIIKGYINRQNRLQGKEEEIKMSLDTDNKDPAYLSGRLFAIYEKIQKDAAPGIDRTIKDTYFSSACSKPAIIIPKLSKLSNYHMGKIKPEYKNYYNNMIEEIIDKIDGEFPETLSLTEQGKFIVGYYQQNKYLYTKKHVEESE